MSTQMTVRLSDESTSFLDDLVRDGTVKSRAAGLDKLVRREMRRVRAERDALIYARTGEDTELADFTTAALERLQDLDR